MHWCQKNGRFAWCVSDGSFMPHAELATSWRMNTSGCRFCRRSAPAPDAGGYITGPRPGDGGPGNEPFTLTCFSIGAAVSLVVGPRPRPPVRHYNQGEVNHGTLSTIPHLPRGHAKAAGREANLRGLPGLRLRWSRPSTRSGPSQPPHSSTSRCGLSASASSGSRSKEGNT